MKHTIIAILAIFLVACASSGREINRDILGQIVKGKTKETEVRELLGKPTSMGYTSEGFKHVTYIYAKSQSKFYNFIPYVGAVTGGSDTETQTLQVWFDEKDVVTRHAYSESAQEHQSGLGAL